MYSTPTNMIRSLGWVTVEKMTRYNDPVDYFDTLMTMLPL